nr:hypothetical protein [Actinomycetota bacterium]
MTERSATTEPVRRRIGEGGSRSFPLPTPAPGRSDDRPEDRADHDAEGPADPVSAQPWRKVTDRGEAGAGPAPALAPQG